MHILINNQEELIMWKKYDKLFKYNKKEDKVFYYKKK